MFEKLNDFVMNLKQIDWTFDSNKFEISFVLLRFKVVEFHHYHLEVVLLDVNLASQHTSHSNLLIENYIEIIINFINKRNKKLENKKIDFLFKFKYN